MTLIKRMKQLCEEQKIIEIHFDNGGYFTAKLLSIADDFIEFEAYGEDHETSLAQHIFPLDAITGITVSSVNLNKEHLEKSFRNSQTTEESPLDG